MKADEALFDVETDKVSTEIPAQANGVVAEILVQAGTTVKVGARLAVIQNPDTMRIALTGEALIDFTASEAGTLAFLGHEGGSPLNTAGMEPW